MIGKRALRKWRVSVADRRCGGPVGSSDGRWLAFALALLTLALTISGCNSSVPTIKNPTATSGAIRLTTDLSSYSVSQAIGVTLMNTSTTTFYTQNDHSACSIVQLQQYVGGATGWASVDPCDSVQATQTLQITPGLQEPFTLAPSAKDNPNAWDAGTYRVLVSYTTNADGVTDPQDAYSAGFTIHS